MATFSLGKKKYSGTSSYAVSLCEEIYFELEQFLMPKLAMNIITFHVFV